jgi:hypothetical protein
MVEVKLAEPYNWSTAIIGSWGSASLGIGLGGHIEAANVKERIKADHIQGHGIGPLKDLGADVNKKGIGRPSAEDHDFGGAVIHKEERHGSAGSNRTVADFVGLKAEGFLAAEEGACVAQEQFCESVGDKLYCAMFGDGAQRGCGGEIRDGSPNSLHCPAPT